MKNLTNILKKEDEDLIIILKNKNLERYLFEFFSIHPADIGIISKKVPFLSNLEMLENIFLPLMYKNNISLKSCYKKFKTFIDKLQLEDILWKRKEKLTGVELFKSMLLRALSVDSKIIFLEYPTREEFDFVKNFIHTLKSRHYLWVLVKESEEVVFNDVEFKKIIL
ncbi:hypothetical protein SAMN04488516_101315 [Desulfonauticus submarinus]|uniref:Uncharacterized protein n=1 Tax=Desulfonauticus submarinus TaxID=206665 RepID=A0A1H0A8V2_9BACT|nr:hypothetical protein [Desulfonauticus submarinus]SDN29654.1 hypothetical protein SAMN04488516_101315 [Desulfonauticus submarinus]